MASSKAALIFLACFLLVNTRGEEDAASPIPAPKYKSSPPPSSPPPPSPPLPPPVSKSPPPNVKSPPPAPPAVEAPPPPSPPKPPKTTQDCFPLCAERCKLHSRKNICLRACVTCCDRCKCVPPGQYGNQEKCGPCYSRMTTRGGKLKCP